MTGVEIGATRMVNGTPGVVVDSRPLGPPQDGRQLYSLTVRTQEGAGAGQSGGQSGGQDPNAVTSGGGAVTGQRPDGLAGGGTGPNDLTPSEKALVEQLKRRDAQVRQEEETHARALGAAAGQIQYEYQRGPDGQNYAIGGSVAINAVTSGDPEAQAELGRRIATAALIVQTPSTTDANAAAAGAALAIAANGEAANEGSAGAAPADADPVADGAVRGAEGSGATSGGLLDQLREANAAESAGGEADQGPARDDRGLAADAASLYGALSEISSGGGAEERQRGGRLDVAA